MPFNLSRNALLCAYAAVAFWLIYAITYALTVTVDLPFFHVDGAFQTASGLYRLDAHLFPGRDFLPYLGIGPLLLLYLPFKIMGANLAASTAGAWMLTLIAGSLAGGTIIHLVTGQRRFVVSLAIASTLFLFGVALIMLFHPTAMGRLPQFMMASVTPGNSQRPLRAFAPYLMVLLFSFFSPRMRSPWSLTLGTAFIAGVLLLWSNDFAYPTALVFGLLFVFVLLPQRGGRWVHRIAYAAATLVIWLVLLTLFTAGHPGAMLSYNFMDVARDQWWLFMPYDDAERFYGIKDIGNLMLPVLRFPGVMLIGITIWAWRTRQQRHVLLAGLGWTTLLGGMLACIGGHVLAAYLYNFSLWGYFTGLGLVVYFIPRVFSNAARRSKPWTILLGLMALAGLVVAGLQTARWQRDLHAAQADTQRFYVPELGGYLSTDWREYIQLARSFKGTVIEEYWGLFSATRRSFSLWHVDAVIHAMGSQRAKAAAALPQADMLISTRSDFHPIQQWSLTHDYWFYRELALNRKVAGYSPTTVIWTRKAPADIVMPPVIACNANQAKSRYEFVAPQAGYYELDAQYDAPAGGRKLVMIQTNVKMVMEPYYEASIDPAAKSVQQIVWVDKAGPTSFYVQGHGAEPFEVKLGACSAFRLPVSDPIAFYNAHP